MNLTEDQLRLIAQILCCLIALISLLILFDSISGSVVYREDDYLPLPRTNGASWHTPPLFDLQAFKELVKALEIYEKDDEGKGN